VNILDCTAPWLRRSGGVLVLLVAAALAPARASAQGDPAWQPPIGIPVPAFGITDGPSTTPPARPNPWNSSVPGFYYVNPSHASATDSDPRGWPAQPRRTIPITLGAGSYVEVCGLYQNPHTSPDSLRLNGTPAAPVWIRAAPASSCTSLPPRITRNWEIAGSTYFIVENLLFADDLADPGNSDTRTGKLDFYGDLGSGAVPVSFGVIRHNEFSGNINGGGITFNVGNLHHIVIWDNFIHDNGNINDTGDQDVHGIGIGTNHNTIWVVDNEIARSSGDGVQVNGDTGSLTPGPGNATSSSTHHIYLGRNHSHHNKQSGLWVKQAMDVVISENHLHDHRPSSSSPGQCTGYQYAPQRVWFLYNYMHDCDIGIILASDNDLGFASPQSYVIGNVAHRIHFTGADGPQAAFEFRAEGPRVVVNNTFHDVDRGIDSQAASGSTLAIVDNIISNVHATGSPQNEAIIIENNTLAANTTVRNNLFSGTFRVTLGPSQFTTAAAINNGTTRTNNISGGPGFVSANPANLVDFALAASSPAVNAGIIDQAYQTFQTLYGLDIRRDIVHNPRGPVYDIGAFELAGADLAVTLADSPDPVLHGGQYAYTITVTNNGPIASDPFTVTLNLPAGAGFVSATTGCTHVSGVVTCPRPALPVSSQVVLTVTVTAPSAPGSATATVTVN
jgi:uncharacterized repeat protein (TIGR01451 family)